MVQVSPHLNRTVFARDEGQLANGRRKPAVWRPSRGWRLFLGAEERTARGSEGLGGDVAVGAAGVWGPPAARCQPSALPRAEAAARGRPQRAGAAAPGEAFRDGPGEAAAAARGGGALMTARPCPARTRLRPRSPPPPTARPRSAAQRSAALPASPGAARPASGGACESFSRLQ